MATGKIKRLVADRGFGFIKPDSNGTGDVFFHCSKVEGDFARLAEGQRVSYEQAAGPDGRPRAEAVRPC